MDVHAERGRNLYAGQGAGGTSEVQDFRATLFHFVKIKRSNNSRLIVLKMIDFNKRSIVITEDGSSTLKLTDFEESYHSVHGAVNESLHVFIEAGLKACCQEKVNLLEIGLGTGLNAILTLMNRGLKDIYYHGIEAYPLIEDEIKNINYQHFMSRKAYQCFLQMHLIPSGKMIEIDEGFSLKKSICRLEDIRLEEEFYDLVYFDAFSPALQEELWRDEIFEKLYFSMRKNAILTTYCAKGAVKRAMKRVGFDVFGLPGPPGKREITQCIKN